MRVLIHVVSIQKTGGSSRHLGGVIPTLSREFPEDEYLLCLNAGFASDHSFTLPNVEVFPTQIHSPWHRIWWDQVSLPRLAQVWRADLILALMSFGCLRPPVPQIAFERIPVYFCRYYLRDLHGLTKLETLLRRELLYATMRASARVVVPTVAMRDMIRRYRPKMPESHFEVIPHAFEREAFRQADALDTRVETELSRERTADDLWLLYVSHLMPHKGYLLLPRLARLLSDRGVAFHIVLTMAREDWPEGYDRFVDEIAHLRVEDRFVVLGRVDERAVWHLYERADVFLFPSLCESFGFPMIEALSSRLPIVAADTAVNREICGPVARYYPPLDMERAADAVASLANSAARRDLGMAARQRFVEIAQSWQTYVTRCRTLMERVLRRVGE
jgi:glycosyltransferase involved in cell wall biosynthesis